MICLPPGNGTPAIPLVYPPSSPSSHFRIRVTTGPLPYTSSQGPASFLLYFPEPSQSSSTASAPYSGSGIPLENCCCYRRLSAQDRGRPPAVAGPPHWSVTRPYLPQIIGVESRVGVAAPLPSWCYQCDLSVNCCPELAYTSLNDSIMIPNGACEGSNKVSNCLAGSCNEMEDKHGTWQLTSRDIVYKPDLSKHIEFFVDAYFSGGWNQSYANNAENSMPHMGYIMMY